MTPREDAVVVEGGTATPRPWQMYRYTHGSGRIHKDERTLIADVHGPEANREFVFEAVNNLDRLRRVEAAAREAIEAIGFWESDGRQRAGFPADRDGESDPDAEAPFVALRRALSEPVA